jgi:mannose-6-phosphate isomerase-like protein (cupin superfamily)
VAEYTLRNLKDDVEDSAVKFGISPNLEARFARVPLELEQAGVSYFRVAPGFRVPWGHSHATQEEIYVVVSGSARVKVNDDVVELGQWGTVRVAPGAMHSFEGGPDGAEIIAFGAPNTENKDLEMVQGWWAD